MPGKSREVLQNGYCVIQLKRGGRDENLCYCSSRDGVGRPIAVILERREGEEHQVCGGSVERALVICLETAHPCVSGW